MSLLTLYLISTLPRLGDFIGGFSILLFVIAAGGLIVAAFEDGAVYGTPDHNWKKLWLTHMKKWGIATCVSISLISTLIPSEKQLYFIAGGYAATNIAGIDKLPGNVVKAANDWLEGINKESEDKK